MKNLKGLTPKGSNPLLFDLGVDENNLIILDDNTCLALDTDGPIYKIDLATSSVVFEINGTADSSSSILLTGVACLSEDKSKLYFVTQEFVEPDDNDYDCQADTEEADNEICDIIERINLLDLETMDVTVGDTIYEREYIAITNIDDKVYGFAHKANLTSHMGSRTISGLVLDEISTENLFNEHSFHLAYDEKTSLFWSKDKENLYCHKRDEGPDQYYYPFTGHSDLVNKISELDNVTLTTINGVPCCIELVKDSISINYFENLESPHVLAHKDIWNNDHEILDCFVVRVDDHINFVNIASALTHLNVYKANGEHETKIKLEDGIVPKYITVADEKLLLITHDGHTYHYGKTNSIKFIVE